MPGSELGAHIACLLDVEETVAIPQRSRRGELPANVEVVPEEADHECSIQASRPNAAAAPKCARRGGRCPATRHHPPPPHILLLINSNRTQLAMAEKIREFVEIPQQFVKEGTQVRKRVRWGEALT